MNFYVGATFTRFREVRALNDLLVAAGHTCAHDWTRSNDFGPDGELVPKAGDGYLELDDWHGKATAEVRAVQRAMGSGGFCLFLGQEASLGWPTEFGMAIMAAQGLILGEQLPRILLVAPFKTTVFVALRPLVTVHETVDGALASLGVERTADAT